MVQAYAPDASAARPPPRKNRNYAKIRPTNRTILRICLLTARIGRAMRPCKTHPIGPKNRQRYPHFWARIATRKSEGGDAAPQDAIDRIRYVK